MLLVTSTCSKLTNRWLLDGTSTSASGTTVIDSVGNWNGVAYGSYNYSGKAINFDGSSAYVNLGSRTFGGAMSFAFWGKVNKNATWSRFLDWGSGSPGNNIMMMAQSDRNVLTVGVYNNAGSTINVYSSYVVPLNVWNHYVFTLDDSGNFVVYLNGASLYSGQTNAVSTATRTHLVLGSSYQWNNYLPGAIKDFQFALGTVFTAGEALYLYNNVCPVGKLLFQS